MPAPPDDDRTARAGARGPLIRPEMNVTPLVDVVLVLLIIFMVITPQLEAGAAVNLPAVANPDGKSGAKLAPLTVSLTARGELYLERERVGRDELLARLAREPAVDARRRLVLRGDRDVRYAEARALFKACQGVGFPGVSLQVGDVRSEERAAWEPAARERAAWERAARERAVREPAAREPAGTKEAP